MRRGQAVLRDDVKKSRSKKCVKGTMVVPFGLLAEVPRAKISGMINEVAVGLIVSNCGQARGQQGRTASFNCISYTIQYHVPHIYDSTCRYIAFEYQPVNPLLAIAQCH